ncbi:MAG: hypothetical protein WB607_20530 [Candidatus Acidiferrum sp.]|jgi:hypothetical protein
MGQRWRIRLAIGWTAIVWMVLIQALIGRALMQLRETAFEAIILFS